MHYGASLMYVFLLIVPLYIIYTIQWRGAAICDAGRTKSEQISTLLSFCDEGKQNRYIADNRLPC